MYVLENKKTGEFAAPFGTTRGGRTRKLMAALAFENAGEAARYKRCNMVHPADWVEVQVEQYLD